MKKLVSIAVILGTYNGEDYLDEQIKSILNQKEVLVHVFARDDGSKDQTVDILRKYASNYQNFHLMNGGKTENKGIKESFMETLKWALSFSEAYEYFAFSDQDDVWLPNKLATGIRKIQRSTNSNGALYYSNKTIVDEKLNIKYREQFIEKNVFSNYYFVSKAYGCTMIINRLLADLSCEFVSSYSHFHDDWIHRLAICLNSDIVFDNDSYILYRQHGENSCGTFATDQKSYLHLIKRALNFLTNGSGQNRTGLSSDILEKYGERIDERNKYKLNLIVNYKKNIWSKIRLIKESNVENKNKREVFIWLIKVVLGYF